MSVLFSFLIFSTIVLLQDYEAKYDKDRVLQYDIDNGLSKWLLNPFWFWSKMIRSFFFLQKFKQSRVQKYKQNWKQQSVISKVWNNNHCKQLLCVFRILISN